MPSSVIHDFAYAPGPQELTIWFVTGRVYVYFGVPAHVFAGLSAAQSKGAYFNRHIRDWYPFRQMSPA